MRRTLFALIISNLIVSFSMTVAQAGITIPKPVKEWTFLVFINGNNNLDNYGAMNINQMEQVGSTDDINVVVQWASLNTKKTQRLYIEKDNSPSVTSPVVADLGTVDMGDWRNLVEFIQWSAARYPAKRYFITVWNHGNGWHGTQQFKPTEISYDDISGNVITTKQLGEAMAEASKIIGHKVDLYASDACLMAMLEIADEMAPYVDIFAGSEDSEPGAGWPYQAILKKWSENPAIGPAEVAKIVTTQYVLSYSGGSNGRYDVTFSAFDLNKIQGLNSAIAALGTNLKTLDKPSRGKVVSAASKSLYFAYSDYIDLGDYLNLIEKQQIEGVSAEALAGVRAAMKDMVVINQATGRFSRAQGVSVWAPSRRSTHEKYSSVYKTLQFQSHSDWNSTLEYLLQDQTY